MFFNIVLLLGCVTLVFSKTLIWRYDNDISNPSLWKFANKKNCKGLIFPDYSDSMYSVKKLAIEQIVFPSNGKLVVEEGAEIEFAKNSTCVTLRELSYKSWFNPNNWISPKNFAIPDAERIPCANDDVKFPKNSTFSVDLTTDYGFARAEANNVNIIQELDSFISSPFSSQMRSVHNFQKAEDSSCANPKICNCLSEESKEAVCDHIKRTVQQNIAEENGQERDYEKQYAYDNGYQSSFQEPHCIDPIQPINHCTKSFCGGMIHLILDPTNVPEISLPKYENVDVYMSYFTKNTNEVKAQITFADKGLYNGESVEKAKEFFESHHLAGLKKTIFTSGAAYYDKSFFSSTFLLLLGTLVGVLVVFGVIYYLYEKPGIMYGSAVYFARFDNKSEADLTYEVENVTIENKFENPLYEKGGTSRSLESIETTVTAIEEPTGQDENDKRDNLSDSEE